MAQLYSAIGCQRAASLIFRKATCLIADGAAHETRSAAMNKKEMKSAETKAKLSQAFITLYQEKPIEKISVREITDAAGYNRAAFYIYYKDIYDLLESIESRLLRYAEKNIPRKALDEESES